MSIKNDSIFWERGIFYVSDLVSNLHKKKKKKEIFILSLVLWVLFSGDYNPQGLVRSSGSMVETASAADLIQRRQRSEFQCKLLKCLTFLNLYEYWHYLLCSTNLNFTLFGFFSECQGHSFHCSEGESCHHYHKSLALHLMCFKDYKLSISLTLTSDWLIVLQANPELVPSALTLALNDALTYDKVRWGIICLYFRSLVRTSIFHNEPYFVSHKFAGYQIWRSKWINTIQVTVT